MPLRSLSTLRSRSLTINSLDTSVTMAGLLLRIGAATEDGELGAWSLIRGCHLRLSIETLGISSNGAQTLF